jgi:hypothetical protein
MAGVIGLKLQPISSYPVVVQVLQVKLGFGWIHHSHSPGAQQLDLLRKWNGGLRVRALDHRLLPPMQSPRVLVKNK